MSGLGLDLEVLLRDVALVLFAFALAFPIGWERGRGSRSTGFRTLPIVAMAACGFALIVESTAPLDVDAQARVLQGVITGIGFIGGGAIIKHGNDVKGLATAASVWNAGAIGAAVGLGRANIAVVLSLVNFASLWFLTWLEDWREDDAE